MCKNSEPWVFTLPEDFSWDSGFTIPGAWEFRDKTGAVRLILRPSGRITVTRRYAWDGCSPKMCVFDILLGTPDGVVDSTTKQPKTYYASLVHDALYQFLLDGLPLKRWQADRCFYVSWYRPASRRATCTGPPCVYSEGYSLRSTVSSDGIAGRSTLWRRGRERGQRTRR